MTLNLRNVADAFAALSVSGLTIKELDGIPSEVGVRSSLLIPLPNYLTDGEVERDSFGASKAAMTVSYTINYRLCYQPVGTTRVMTLDVFQGLVQMVGLIWDAVLAIDVFIAAHSEVVDIIPVSISNMGIVNDPADMPFYGCDLAFRVQEFVN